MPSKILSLIGLAALVGAATSAPHPGILESNEARRLSTFSDETTDEYGYGPEGTTVPSGSGPEGTAVPSPVEGVPDTPTPVETPWPVGTPGPAATQAPLAGGPGYESLDCYIDYPSPRIMGADSVLGHPEMTTEECEAFCSGYSYFGTQYSEECWCGDEATVLDLYGDAGAGVCDYPCSGDNTTVCGGYWAMSVYKYTA